MDRTDDEQPLQGEARARSDWRGDESPIDSTGAAGHTLPASEDEDERLGGASAESGASGKSAASAGLGMVPPPD